MEELTLITSVEAQNDVHAANRGSHKTRALFEPLLIHRRILGQIVAGGLGEWMAVKLLDLRDPHTARDPALIRRRQLPARATLHVWDDELCHVLEGRADEKTLSLLLATMLDGFPRGMVPNVQIYVEAALLVPGDQALSPDIFAAAIIRIWRKDRFPPTRMPVTCPPRSSLTFLPRAVCSARKSLARSWQ